jgi:hypothetical protein
MDFPLSANIIKGRGKEKGDRIEIPQGRELDKLPRI